MALNTATNDCQPVTQSRSEANRSDKLSGVPSAAEEILRRRLAANSLSIEPPQIEICLSPLLWSESVGFLVDG